MRKAIIIALFLIFLILTSIIVPSIYAKEIVESEEPRERLFDIAAKLFFSATVGIFGIPWNVLRFTEPDPWIADREYIEIGFYDTTSINIGVINESTGNYKLLKDFDYYSLFPSAEFEFTIEFPEYLPENIFIAKFDPQILQLYKEGEAKTQLTLISKVPENLALPENIMIRVNITKYVTAQNTYLPPKHNRGIIPFCFIFGKPCTFLWFLAAIGVFGFAFGPYYSGKRVADYSMYVDLIVKLKREHLIDIITPDELIEVQPDSIYSIPIEIKNFGSHIDTFNFNVSTTFENGLTICPPPTITLNSNEITTVNLGIATSDELWDPGTLHSIKVEAYSIYEPDLSFNNTVSLVTKGIYVSENNAASLIFSILIIIILLIIAYLFRKTIKTKLKAFKKFKIKKEIGKVKESKMKQIKQKPVPAKKEEIVETEVVKEKPIIKLNADRKIEEERRKKEKAIARIRKQQDKQRP